MDKQEIQRKIDSISADREALEQTKNKLTGDIALLVQQIAEAEKPKPRHGDFGYGTTGGPRIVLSHNFELVTAGNGSIYEHEYEGYNPNPVLGNIFDLLDGEPLTEFETDVHLYKYRPEMRHAPILIAGNSHTMDEALEHWQKLGRLIFTAISKQSK